MQGTGSAQDLKRALHGARVQEEMRETFNRQVDDIKKDSQVHSNDLDSKFSEVDNQLQKEFNESIIGLVTADDFEKRHEKLVSKEGRISSIRDRKAAKKKKRKRGSKKGLLSFQEDLDGEEDVFRPKKKRKKINKNRTVDTSFLPDRERDRQDAELKIKLRKEYVEKMKELEKMHLELTFAYWDGSHHRRTIQMTRGTKIVTFLRRAQAQFEGTISDLMGLTGDNMMFIKDDMIIPHSFTFNDLIQSKARGRSKNEMFDLEFYEDVETGSKMAKDTAKQARIVTRAYYERNKHLFPANKWVTYDPSQHSLEKDN